MTLLYKSVTCPDFDMYPQMLKRKDKTINQNCEENWFDSNLITFSRWCLQGWVASKGGAPRVPSGDSIGLLGTQLVSW